MRFSNFTRHVQMLKPQSAAAAAEAFTSSIDCLGYRWAEIKLSTGTATGTIATSNIEESDSSGSGFADVTGANFPAITASNDDAAYVIKLDMTKRKRYLRVAYDVDTNPVLMSIEATLSDPLNEPATASDTVSATV